ncbi:MAG: TonB-dependent receptor [Bacteroidia bacterium]
MRKIYLLLAILLSLTTVTWSQVKVTGTVKDAKGSGLPGVTVVEKGTSNGTSTKNDGTYSLTVPGNDAMLVFSYIGYQKQEIKASDAGSVTLTEDAVNISDVVIVGSRRAGRVKTETPVPVDVISVSQVSATTGRGSVTALLNYSAPSLNFNKQSGSDGADHIDLATLRGLGPDQTLVLINGKRRHQTAFVSVFGTRGRGNSGTDMSAIPASAIDRVEILRDGASAQYGSDAIAGVINLVLKRDVKVFTGDLSYGGYSDKDFNPSFDKSFGQYETGDKFDGQTINFNGNYGVPLGKKDGFINFSVNVMNQTKTFRQVLDTSNLFTNDDALPINPYRRANGDGSVTAGGGFINLELPCGSGNTKVYAFGGYNYSSSDAFAFTRNWSARPERFPTDPNGNLIFVDGIMHTTPENVDQGIPADTFFNPHIQTHVSDGSLAVGVNGRTMSNWNWDVSNNTGRNDFHFYGDKTFNASLGSGKTHFDDGGFSFLQNTTNVNFTKEIGNIAQGFNLALGAEYRMEKYELYAGEEASYKNYDTSGVKATGAQGFPGYQPADEVTDNRSTVGVYIDAELDITKKWLITGAIRAENYSDFGFTVNEKFSTRYKVADNFSIRGSVSTGFRAPSLQQINFSSTFTTVQGATVAEVKIAPNYSEITKSAGIPELTEEKSVNAGIGFTYSPVKNFNITVDAYTVMVKDRVVLSGQFDASDATLDTNFTNTLNALSVAYAQFFANAVNTTNNGVDIVLEYKKVTENNSFRATLAGNIQKMTIDSINVPEKLNDTELHRKTFLSDREQAFILASAPKSKFSLSLEYGIKKLSVGLRFTYFGDVTLLGYGEDALGIDPQVPTDLNDTVYVPDKYDYSGKLVTDLFITYKITKGITLCVGSDNIFGIHPDFGAVKSAKGWAYNNEPAGPWDAVQMGGNGRYIYAKLGLKF